MGVGAALVSTGGVAVGLALADNGAVEPGADDGFGLASGSGPEFTMAFLAQATTVVATPTLAANRSR